MGRYVRLVMLLLLMLPLPIGRTLHQLNKTQNRERQEGFDALRLRPLKIVARPQPPSELLACNKPPCRLPNVQVSSGAMPVNEHSLAVNPRNPREMFSSGNDYNCAAIQGLYTSNDGGSTWTRKCMPVLQGYSGSGDVVGDYDRNGVLYVAAIDASSRSVNAVVTASKNNGNTWSTPVMVPGIFNNMDKPWLAIDKAASSPHANSLYVSATDFGSSVSIVVSHSADGGKNWKTVLVDNPGSARDQFSALAVAKDGTVYVSWMRCTLGRENCAGVQASFWISKSVDGGEQWSKPVQIASAMLSPFSNGGFYGTLPNTNERVFDAAVLGIDNSSGAYAGTLYAVIYNWTGAFMQVLVTHSVDGGANWSYPIAVSPPSVSHDQFMHWLSVSSSGVLAVTWLDRRNDPANLKYQPFLALSTDGGATFGKNRPLSATLSNPLDDGFGGNFMGDYRVNLWVGRTVYAVWMDTRVGNCQDEIGGMQF